MNAAVAEPSPARVKPAAESTSSLGFGGESNIVLCVHWSSVTARRAAVFARAIAESGYWVTTRALPRSSMALLHGPPGAEGMVLPGITVRAASHSPGSWTRAAVISPGDPKMPQVTRNVPTPPPTTTGATPLGAFAGASGVGMSHMVSPDRRVVAQTALLAGSDDS
jgi:hypothetical protein